MGALTPNALAIAGGAGGGGGAASRALLTPGASLASAYEVKEIIGQGSSSVCYRCLNTRSSREYAVKVIDKRKVLIHSPTLVAQLLREIDILRTLEHPNIIRLYDVFETDQDISVVTELVRGGELFDYIIEQGALSERDAAGIIRQVVSAVDYLHSQNVIHRDLKPENLLLTHRGPDAQIKLIDFGSSVNLQGGATTSLLGTLGYVAPEVLRAEPYTAAVDMWAVGVITFVLLCGCFPFNQTDLRASRKRDYKLKFPKWASTLSDSSKEFIKSLLRYSPDKRATAAQALRHPWLSGRTASSALLESPGRLRGLRPRRKLSSHSSDAGPHMGDLSRSVPV